MNHCFCFLPLNIASSEMPLTAITLNLMPGISPFDLPFLPNPATVTSSFSVMQFRHPSQGTNAATFFPFFFNITLTPFLTAELGCFDYTPIFSTTNPLAMQLPMKGFLNLEQSCLELQVSSAQRCLRLVFLSFRPARIPLGFPTPIGFQQIINQTKNLAQQPNLTVPTELTPASAQIYIFQPNFLEPLSPRQLFANFSKREFRDFQPNEPSTTRGLLNSLFSLTAPIQLFLLKNAPPIICLNPKLIGLNSSTLKQSERSGLTETFSLLLRQNLDEPQLISLNELIFYVSRLTLYLTANQFEHLESPKECQKDPAFRLCHSRAYFRLDVFLLKPIEIWLFVSYFPEDISPVPSRLHASC